LRDGFVARVAEAYVAGDEDVTGQGGAQDHQDSALCGAERKNAGRGRRRGV
jgi:hypothetical protein